MSQTKQLYWDEICALEEDVSDPCPWEKPFDIERIEGAAYPFHKEKRHGEIKASYAALVEAFGEPTWPFNSPEPETKIRVCFYLCVNGVYLSIHDWKDDKALHRIEEWVVHSNDNDCLKIIEGVMS